jgi:hypothetical protein
MRRGLPLQHPERRRPAHLRRCGRPIEAPGCCSRTSSGSARWSDPPRPEPPGRHGQQQGQNGTFDRLPPSQTSRIHLGVNASAIVIVGPGGQQAEHGSPAPQPHAPCTHGALLRSAAAVQHPGPQARSGWFSHTAPESAQAGQTGMSTASRMLSPGRESNSLPPNYEFGALPVELPGQAAAGARYEDPRLTGGNPETLYLLSYRPGSALPISRPGRT